VHRLAYVSSLFGDSVSSVPVFNVYWCATICPGDSRRGVHNVSQFGEYSAYLTRRNKIATEIIKSRWQVDKEALWLMKSPTYLPKYIRI